VTKSLSFGFRIADRGVAASSGRAEVVHHQLEQLLLTMPGERVDRPTFGCGIQALVFAGAAPEVAAATEYLVGTAIRRYLSDVLTLDAVRVLADDSTLYVDVLYTLRETGEELAASISHPLQAPP
jgi:phage baseplate assembly protein W